MFLFKIMWQIYNTFSKKPNKTPNFNFYYYTPYPVPYLLGYGVWWMGGWGGERQVGFW
jgi:hypothetical protein